MSQLDFEPNVRAPSREAALLEWENYLNLTGPGSDASPQRCNSAAPSASLPFLFADWRIGVAGIVGDAYNPPAFENGKRRKQFAASIDFLIHYR